MIEKLEMYEVTRRKLNRELKEKELEFLEWLYERYALEEEEASKEVT